MEFRPGLYTVIRKEIRPARRAGRKAADKDGLDCRIREENENEISHICCTLL